MKKNIIVLMGICFLQLSCKEKKTNYQKPKPFDEKKIAMYKSHNKWEYTANDTLFKLEEFDSFYVETIKPIHENFYNILYYYKKTLALQAENQYFDDMPIGVFKDYDKYGDVIKQEDCDKNFHFSVYDLIDKVKSDFNIDLNKDLNGIKVYKTSDGSMFPKYYIYIPLKTDDWYPKYRLITIDGTFGFTISDKIKIQNGE